MNCKPITNENVFITVFTPAYNRAHLLPRAYESLKRQGYLDFEWIIVDDGSTDDTEAVVSGWLENSEFPIRYIKKENGGKHTAINRGVEEAKGELFFILDSDDMLTDDALQIVVDEYETVRGDATFGGVCGLDCYQDGKIVGGGLLQNAIDCNAIDIRYKHHVTGDLKEVFRTEVLREFPFPEIQGERFCPEQLVWFRIAQKYKLHYFNKPIYIAEYQGDGLTAGITRARMNSPIASMMCYQEMTTYKAVPFLEKCKAAINYWRFRCCRNYGQCRMENGQCRMENGQCRMENGQCGMENGQCGMENVEWKIDNGELPRLHWRYTVLAPLGYIMHLKDMRQCRM